MNLISQNCHIGKAIAASTIALALIAGSPMAQAQVQKVEVRNTHQRPVNTRSTVRNIPFYCAEVILTVGPGKTPVCYRADSRESVTPVPAGYKLVVTDIVTNRNALIDSGSFFLTVGKAGTGAFPVAPRFNFSGDQAQSPTIHFTSPYIVLWEGERLQLSNGDSLGKTVDVFVSGYIVQNNHFGR